MFVMWNFLLIPFSWIYRAVIVVRHKLFDSGLLKSRRFDIPVICIGNITVGGTGKTPFAEMLIRHFCENYNVALLSRGYGRRTKGYLEVQTTTPCSRSGDEPKQIKLKFPNAVVAVCERRAEGIDTIRCNHPEVNLIIMDDGFQHRRVEAKVNIVLIDYTRPLHEDHMLPWGRLRDLPSQLHRAHFVCMTKCPPTMNALQQRITRKELSLYPYQCLFFTRVVSGTPQPIFPSDAPPTVTAGVKVIAMAAIGNPSAFVHGLENRYDVVDTIIFGDHHSYRVADLSRMRKALDSAPEGTVIVTTEKDAVKLTSARKIPVEIRSRLYLMPIHISFVDNSKEDFLHKLEYDVRTNQTNRLFYSREG